VSSSSLILVGGGGHCRAVIDLIALLKEHRIEGILDKKEHLGRTVSGYPIIGTDDMIPELVEQGHRFLVTAGQVNASSLRKQLFDAIVQAGGLLATIVSPLAYVSSNAELGAGIVIGHGAVVNTGAIIGANCIINTGAIVEHDARVAEHCHVATGAIVNGDCSVGTGSLIGSRAVLLQGVRIMDNCIIGAGAVVLRDVPQGLTVFGVPARPLMK